MSKKIIELIVYDAAAEAVSMVEKTLGKKLLRAISEQASTVAKMTYGSMFEFYGGADEQPQYVNPNDNAYATFFANALKKFGVNGPEDFTDENTKAQFFQYVDNNWKAQDSVQGLQAPQGTTLDQGTQTLLPQTATQPQPPAPAVGVPSTGAPTDAQMGAPTGVGGAPLATPPTSGLAAHIPPGYMMVLHPATGTMPFGGSNDSSSLDDMSPTGMGANNGTLPPEGDDQELDALGQAQSGQNPNPMNGDDEENDDQDPNLEIGDDDQADEDDIDPNDPNADPNDIQNYGQGDDDDSDEDGSNPYGFQGRGSDRDPNYGDDEDEDQDDQDDDEDGDGNPFAKGNDDDDDDDQDEDGDDDEDRDPNLNIDDDDEDDEDDEDGDKEAVPVDDDGYEEEADDEDGNDGDDEDEDQDDQDEDGKPVKVRFPKKKITESSFPRDEDFGVGVANAQDAIFITEVLNPMIDQTPRSDKAAHMKLNLAKKQLGGLKKIREGHLSGLRKQRATIMSDKTKTLHEKEEAKKEIAVLGRNHVRSCNRQASRIKKLHTGR